MGLKVSNGIPDWKAVLRREKSAGEICRDYVHCHAVMLIALGYLGAGLISAFPDNLESMLEELTQVDWL